MDIFDESPETYGHVPVSPSPAQLTKARLRSAMELLQDVDTGTDMLTPDVQIHVTTATVALRKALARYAWIPE